MRNIYLIPTISVSGVAYYTNYRYTMKPRLQKAWIESPDYDFQHIYITDPNKELEVGDVFIVNNSNCKPKLKVVEYSFLSGVIMDQDEIRYTVEACDKVVMSTDTNLMRVQIIGKEFIDWFVENSECESVVLDSKYVKSDKSILNAEFGDYIKSPIISSKLLRVDSLILDMLESYIKDGYSIYKEEYSILIPDNYVKTSSWLDKEDSSDFTKELTEYFRTVPIEQILDDWSKSKSFDEIGPTVSEFEDSMNTSKVNRIEVPSDQIHGMAYIIEGLNGVEVQLQDDGRILKIFTR